MNNAIKLSHHSTLAQYCEEERHQKRYLNKPRRDDATLVEPSSEVDYDLASMMIVNHFKLSNVAVLHYHCEEADDYF